MCGGFNCSKNALTALNVLFLLVSIVLIATASYAKAAGAITSIQIAGGVIACGLFLFVISILGLVAASKHHQVLLFFYFVVLFLLFLIQFSVSIACLALSRENVDQLVGGMWANAENNTVVKQSVHDAEVTFKCCGWDKELPANRTACVNEICQGDDEKCDYCGMSWLRHGCKLLGVYLAVRYRNQKDPKANPSQFL